MIIKFTETEISILDYIAHLRYRETSKKAKEQKQDLSKNSRDIVRHGVYTEYAAAKHINVFFDLNCDYRKFGADLVTWKGTKVDVKSTISSGGPINARKNSVSKPADIFICTEVDDANGEVKIIGYIERDELLQDANLHDIGNGPYYSLPQTYLKKLNGFKY